MANTGHRGHTVANAPKPAEASHAEVEVVAPHARIRYYNLGNFLGVREMVVSAGEETHLVGVPTLITAPDASFGLGETEVPGRVPQQLEQNVSEVLANQGLDETLLEQIKQIVDKRVAQQVGLLISVAKGAGAEASQAPSSRIDPAVMLTADKFGARLGGLSDETVRLREKAGQLFSILPEGRHRGREYPTFQLLPGIAGKPLEALLNVLGDLGGALIYQFMTSPNDLLGGLSPLQLLIKEPGGDETAASLLGLPDAQRLDAVLNCAADFHAELTA
jgi:hypothetical protein